MASLCPSDPFHLCSSFRMRDQCTSGSTGCHLVWFFLCIVPSVLITLCFPNFLTTSLMTLTFQCVCSRSLISHSVVKYFFPVTRFCCCAACISSLENGWNMMSTSCVSVCSCSAFVAPGCCALLFWLHPETWLCRLTCIDLIIMLKFTGILALCVCFAFTWLAIKSFLQDKWSVQVWVDRIWGSGFSKELVMIVGSFPCGVFSKAQAGWNQFLFQTPYHSLDCFLILTPQSPLCICYIRLVCHIVLHLYEDRTSSEQSL